MTKLHLPENVSLILKTLQNEGYRAFIVGGCVRDSLLLKTPNDWDIATSAKPEEIKKLFPKTIDTGITHGTVTVISDGIPYEVTTFRKDGEYKDSRHPEYVEYTDDLIEDLSRRDFTVNAICYNENEGILDLFGGMDDIKNKTIVPGDMVSVHNLGLDITDYSEIEKIKQGLKEFLEGNVVYV